MNGTAKMLTDNRGRVVWPGSGAVSNELLPFGKDLDFDPAQPDPVEASYNLTFTGKEIDRALGLHYFGARWYDAGAGRFLSPDPVGGDVESPLSWNRYLYCRNDPVNKIDPDGKDEIVLIDKNHVAVAVGPVNGKYTYYSKAKHSIVMRLFSSGGGNRSGKKEYSSKKELLTSARKMGYKEYAVIKTNFKKTKAAKDVADKLIKEPYSVSTNNCATLTKKLWRREVLKPEVQIILARYLHLLERMHLKPANCRQIIVPQTAL